MVLCLETSNSQSWKKSATSRLLCKNTTESKSKLPSNMACDKKDAVHQRIHAQIGKALCARSAGSSAVYLLFLVRNVNFSYIATRVLSMKCVLQFSQDRVSRAAMLCTVLKILCCLVPLNKIC